MNKRWFQRFDCFPKIDSELLVKTQSGGLLSTIILGVLAILLLSEIHNWRSLKYRHEFLIDQSSHENTLNVNLDITVAMKCEFARIDVLDVSGSNLHVGSSLSITPVNYHIGGVQDLSSHFIEEQRIPNQNRPVEGDHQANAHLEGNSN